MPMWRPDPTFYPSPKMAMQAPAEKLAFVAMLNAKDNGRPDALGVVDVDPSSTGYGHLVGQVDMPGRGRIASFRMERVQRLPVPARSTSARRRPLPGRGGRQFAAHSYHRHQARSAEAANREGDRARDVSRANGIHITAYNPLRSGRNLCQRIGSD